MLLRPTELAILAVMIPGDEDLAAVQSPENLAGILGRREREIAEMVDRVPGLDGRVPGLDEHRIVLLYTGEPRAQTMKN